LHNALCHLSALGYTDPVFVDDAHAREANLTCHEDAKSITLHLPQADGGSYSVSVRPALVRMRAWRNTNRLGTTRK